MAKGKTNQRNGALYGRWLRREARLIDKIDQRQRSGKNSENVDDTMSRHFSGTAESGDRVWSF